MSKRIELHSKLVSILGSENVYFQPPESIKLKYPCIIYKREKFDPDFANNQKYSYLTRYQVITIDRDPDATWLMDVFHMPLCSHERHYTHEGLNHEVFQLYY